MLGQSVLLNGSDGVVKWIGIWLVSLGLAFYAGYLLDRNSDDLSAQTSSQLLPSDANNEADHRQSASKTQPTISEQSVTAAYATTKGSSRVSELGQFIEGMAGLDEVALVELLQKQLRNNGHVGNSWLSMRLVLMRLAEVNPELALQMTIDNPALSARETLGQNAVMQIWAQKDVLAALNWLEQRWLNEPLSEDDKFYYGNSFGLVIGQLLKQNKEQAVNLLKAKKKEMAGNFSSFLAFGIAAQFSDSDQIHQTLIDFENADLGQLSYALLRQWATFDPQSAADYMDFDYTGTKENELAQMVAMGWMPSEPEQAATWLLQRSTPETIQDAFGDIFNLWGRGHPEEKLAWFKQQSLDADDRQKGVEVLMLSSVYLYPEFVAEQLEQVASVEKKQQLAANVYGRLKRAKKDKAAEEFLMTSPYQAYIQEQLQKTSGKGN